MKVLLINSYGYPVKWISVEQACNYYVTQRILYDFGEKEIVLRGGFNRITQKQSILAIKSMVVVRGNCEKFDYHADEILRTSQIDLLLERDKRICAYCGEEFRTEFLTRDHIIPKSRGGTDSWMNSVTACLTCNFKKGNRTPEEAKMELLYLPYIPCMNERLILENRNILGDQMEFLKSRLPIHSRVL